MTAALLPLLRLLDEYAGRHPDELGTVQRIRDLVLDHDDCLLRSCVPGHITASAWVVSPDRRRFLLTHHRKLHRWLQLGGHVDGEPEVHRAALREAREESGMERFRFLPEEPLCPIDIDVHTIPAHGVEPAHEHHDIRFLLVAEEGQALVVSDESNDLRWFPLDALDQVAGDESVARLGRKARALLDEATAG